MVEYTPVKDSNERIEYGSGMRRDIQEDKPRFDLLFPKYVPYEHQWITQLAMHMNFGARKYGERNWELANSVEELERFKGSALRHLTQAYMGQNDENHLAATIFNIIAWISLEWKLDNKEDTSSVKRELDERTYRR